MRHTVVPFRRVAKRLQIAFAMVTVLGVSVLCAPAHAQLNPDKTFGQTQYSIVHSAPKSSALPLPGQPLTLTVQLKNWEDTSRLLRTVIVEDGKLLYTASNAAYFNEYEQPTYDIEIPSPKASLEYQFFFEGGGGETVKSSRYVVSRKCLLDTSLKDIDYRAESQLNDRIPLLVQQADKLEKELISYETTLDLLNDLIKGLPE
jgi:hypothetical protein